MFGKREFFVAGEAVPVGVLRGPHDPTAPGRYEFDPYRGEGHAVFAGLLDAGRAAPCWFRRWGRRVGFTVTHEELVLRGPGEASTWYLEVSQVGGVSVAEPDRPHGFEEE